MSVPVFPLTKLTPRDHFAAMAMQGIMTNENLCLQILTEAQFCNQSSYLKVAQHAYRMADAMMEARK